jgi:hypothetical protein
MSVMMVAAVLPAKQSLSLSGQTSSTVYLTLPVAAHR